VWCFSVRAAVGQTQPERGQPERSTGPSVTVAFQFLASLLGPLSHNIRVLACTPLISVFACGLQLARLSVVLQCNVMVEGAQSMTAISSHSSLANKYLARERDERYPHVATAKLELGPARGRKVGEREKEKHSEEQTDTCTRLPAGSITAGGKNEETCAFEA